MQTGNTVLVIEHNLDVIKTADYMIDLGPEGGDKGGTVVGDRNARRKLPTNPNSYTGAYLAPVLAISGRSAITSPDAIALERMERENLAVLDDLAKARRVAVEA